MSTASGEWVQGGRAIRLQHGPIDLVCRAEGQRDAVREAYQQVSAAFDSVLDDLVSELSLLRMPVNPPTRTQRCDHQCEGAVAKRMVDACRPFADDQVITPMAAVAGSVADHLLSSVENLAELNLLWINNGGDIAVYLGTGESFNLSCKPFLNW